MRATLVMMVRRWQTAPYSMQMRGCETRDDGQAKPETCNPPDPSGSAQKPKSAPLHEIGGQLL